MGNYLVANWCDWLFPFALWFVPWILRGNTYVFSTNKLPCYELQRLLLLSKCSLRYSCRNLLFDYWESAPNMSCTPLQKVSHELVLLLPFFGIHQDFSLKLNKLSKYFCDGLLDDGLSRSLIVCWSCSLVGSELLFVCLASQPVESHIHGFCSLWLDCLFTTPTAGVLSTCIGVGGWGYPISSRRCLCGTNSLEFI